MKRLEPSRLKKEFLSDADAEQLYRMFPETPMGFLTGCPTCGKNRGEYVDGTVVLPTGPGGAVEEWGCDCQDQLSRHKHYLSAGIGMTYQVLNWTDWDGSPDVMAQLSNMYLNDFESKLATGAGLVLMSKSLGTGKTFVATLVLRMAIRDYGVSGFMTTYADMLTNMKKGWRDAEFSGWYERKVNSSKVLVVDDLGREASAGDFGWQFSTETLDSLIRTRVQQSKVTIITTNLLPDPLEQRYGEAVKSLLTEKFLPILMEGDDYRKNSNRGMSLPPKGRRRIW